jgi:hypothetical protein
MKSNFPSGSSSFAPTAPRAGRELFDDQLWSKLGIVFIDAR